MACACAIGSTERRSELAGSSPGERSITESGPCSNQASPGEIMNLVAELGTGLFDKQTPQPRPGKGQFRMRYCALKRFGRAGLRLYGMMDRGGWWELSTISVYATFAHLAAPTLLV